MRRRKFQIKLTYFKPSGKYYSEGECEVEAGEIVAGEGTPEAYSIAYTYDVLDAVALMDAHPGLAGRWTEGPILVTGPEMSPPHLITDLEGLTRRARRHRDADRAVERFEEATRPEGGGFVC
jgi:hypothetical protein